MRAENVTVERVGDRGNSLLVGGEWYTTYKAASLGGAKERDVVSFNYDVVDNNPKYPGKVFQNIKGMVTVVSACAGTATDSTGVVSRRPSSFPAPSTALPGEPVISRQRCIIRENAVTSAIAYFGVQVPRSSVTMDEVLQAAKVIEAYTSGDDDAAKVSGLIDKLTKP